MLKSHLQEELCQEEQFDEKNLEANLSFSTENSFLVLNELRGDYQAKPTSGNHGAQREVKTIRILLKIPLYQWFLNFFYKIALFHVDILL